MQDRVADFKACSPVDVLLSHNKLAYKSSCLTDINLFGQLLFSVNSSFASPHCRHFFRSFSEREGGSAVSISGRADNLRVPFQSVCVFHNRLLRNSTFRDAVIAA